MSVSFLSLLVMQCFMFAAIYVLWVKLHRAPEDDPRLTKGLQLLQSKIAVLEDLSDRTETQVNQLTALMENKIKEIQLKIMEADRVINNIELKIQKSMDVAKIFQDKIPHQEILDRQYTIKYVKAAKLAHQGLTTDEIAKQVDLTPAEIELILKLNKEQLMFSDEDLPEWIEETPQEPSMASSVTNTQWVDFEKAFEVPQVDKENLKRLGDQFKEALTSRGQNKQNLATSESANNIDDKGETDIIKNKLLHLGAELMSDSAGKASDKSQVNPSEKPYEGKNQKGKMVSMKPFEFKRIESAPR